MGIINVVIPDSKIFLCIPMSVADSPAINPNDIITSLANDLSNGLFFIKNRIVFRMAEEVYVEVIQIALFEF